MRVNSTLHIEALSIFVHGMLAFGHFLGLAHNLRKRNKFDCAMHAGALAYDVWAVCQHHTSILELEAEVPEPHAFIG